MDLAHFFETFVLYQEYKIVEDFNNKEVQMYFNPVHFEGITFEYYCELESKLKTFEIEIDDAEKYLYELQTDRIDDKYFKGDKLNYFFMTYGKCRSCKNYRISIPLQLYSDNIIPKKILSTERRKAVIQLRHATEHEPVSNLYIKKIGMYPEIRVSVDKRVSKLLDREACSWYFKGLDLISKNYGVGAFAYFRRVIEKELIHIIELIKNLPDAEEKEINKLLEEYKKSPNTSTIYENIFQYLPASLKELGDNPIKLLYNQTSEGLHSLSEEECLGRAQNIALILEFTLIKINEEKSHILDVKNAIKGLRS